jgi:hypothetical protein
MGPSTDLAGVSWRYPLPGIKGQMTMLVNHQSTAIATIVLEFAGRRGVRSIRLGRAARRRYAVRARPRLKACSNGTRQSKRVRRNEN